MRGLSVTGKRAIATLPSDVIISQIASSLFYSCPYRWLSRDLTLLHRQWRS